MDIYFNYLNESVSLIKTNGTYKVPNLAGVVMQLPDLIPYRLNLITYAHLEMTYFLTGWTVYHDSMWGSPYIETIGGGTLRLMIPTVEAISAGSTTGIRINTWNGGKFQVYQDGKLIPEELPKLSLSLPVPSTSKRALKVPSYVPAPLPIPTLNIVGGEIGRTYCVTKSTNGPSGPWFDTGIKHQITPDSNSTNMLFEMSGNTFIRLQSTNTPPVYQ